MKRYISVKTLLPVGLFVLEAIWLKLTYGIPTASTDAATFATNASFPRFVLLLMMACTVTTFVWELITTHRLAVEGGEEDPLARRDVCKVLVLVLVIFAYVIIMPKLGFIITTIALMFIAGWLYGQKRTLLVIVSIAFPILLYAVFRFGLKIMLPTLFL